jgi:hypothetical protein
MLVNLIHALPEIPPFARLTMVVAVAAFGLAVAYVLRPTVQKLALMRPVSLAVIFATVTGVLGGWIEILTGIAATASGQVPNAALWLGIATSLITGFVCFGFLAAAWVLIAVGMLRRGNADVG